MATKRSTGGSAITVQLASGDSLRCSICLETFKEPKVLPCCHTFCKECLSKLPVTKKSKSAVVEVSEDGKEEKSISTMPEERSPVHLDILDEVMEDVAMDADHEPYKPLHEVLVSTVTRIFQEVSSELPVAEGGLG